MIDVMFSTYIKKQITLLNITYFQERSLCSVSCFCAQHVTSCFLSSVSLFSHKSHSVLVLYFIWKVMLFYVIESLVMHWFFCVKEWNTWLAIYLVLLVTHWIWFLKWACITCLIDCAHLWVSKCQMGLLLCSVRRLIAWMPVVRFVCGF